jgi:hypothetical protein
MKRLLFFTVLTITVTIASAQKSIDALFEKYAGKDGFTTVTINGNILKLASCFDDDHDDDLFPADITMIRIITQENENIKTENFYDLVINDINLDNYDEFMRVKNSEQDMRMLVRADGNKIKEFLLIAGGQDNALIQIKGNMTFAEANKFSGEVKKNHGLNIVGNHRN